jgi:hypothetical protein
MEAHRGQAEVTRHDRRDVRGKRERLQPRTIRSGPLECADRAPPSELPYDPLLYWGIRSAYPWGVCLCVSMGIKVRLLTFVCGTNSAH